MAPTLNKENILSVVNTEGYKRLSLGQKIAFHGAMAGDNMVITGGGGVGKSYLISFMEQHIPNLVLSATTGIAAINILAQTIDSFLGFFAGDISNPHKMSKKIRDRLKEVTRLLIDEGSMLRIDKIMAMDERLRTAKGVDKPFGGIQIILVGDFMQLPPVVSKREDGFREFKNTFGNKKFPFESDVYADAEFTPYVLHEYIRLEHGPTQQALRNVRMGNNLDNSISLLNSAAKGSMNDDTIHLVGTNNAAWEINEEKYNAINSRSKLYKAKSSGEVENNIVPANINLKEGCRVLLCANNSESGYYNGDVGTVVKLNARSVDVELDRGGVVEVEEFEWKINGYAPTSKANEDGSESESEDGTEESGLEKVEIGSYTQIPIKMAWAITIHKSQGLTLDNICLYFGGIFEQGQAYVALSRARNYDNVIFKEKLMKKHIKFSSVARTFTIENSQAALKRIEKDIERFGIDV
jgi:ATP-dependent DNA helicase PIF1